MADCRETVLAREGAAVAVEASEEVFFSEITQNWCICGFMIHRLQQNKQFRYKAHRKTID
jgi:hypothetical protein